MHTPKLVSQKTAPCEPWANSALLAWSLAAAAFVLASFCLASLTADGSYYLFGTLHDGFPMAPHHRWPDWALLMPVLWARSVIDHPAGLAVVQGLMYSLVPLTSFAVCLRMLRGEFAPLRFWVALGILLAPLPGQMVMVSEATFTLQVSWVCLAFVWRGCPLRWTPAVALAAVFMWGLHPVSAATFFLVAATAGVLGFAMDALARRRLWIAAGVFAVASVAKAAELLVLASPYERAHLHGSAWLEESKSGLLLTPFIVLIPVFMDAGLRLWTAFFGKATPSNRERTSRYLWIAAFVLGVIYTFYPGGWTGAISFRKFGILVSAPVAVMAGLDAWRIWRNAPSPQRSLITPVLLFAVMLGGMAVSWKYVCGSMMARLNAQPGLVQWHEELPWIERNSALNHWSTTSLSLILQGWEPRKVHLWRRDLQLPPHGFCICPENVIPCEDKGFKLTGLKPLWEAPPSN